MIPFEIHITGNKSIHSLCSRLGIRTISVDLLKPTKNFFKDAFVLRTEHMTSECRKFVDYESCKDFVDALVDTLSKVNIVRVKIECPVVAQYIDKAIYVESHWYTDDITIEHFPLSRNQYKKDKIMATDREYDPGKFIDFNNGWQGKSVVELCLYDSNVLEDQDWFDLYEPN